MLQKKCVPSHSCAVLETLKPRSYSLKIYGIFSQHFDTSLQLLLPVTKFNRAKLVVFAFSD